MVFRLLRYYLLQEFGSCSTLGPWLACVYPVATSLKSWFIDKKLHPLYIYVVVKNSLQTLSIFYPLIPYESVPMALFIPLQRYKHFPNFTPLLKNLPKIFFTDLLRESGKVEGSYVRLLPPR